VYSQLLFHVRSWPPIKSPRDVLFYRSREQNDPSMVKHHQNEHGKSERESIVSATCMRDGLAPGIENIEL
jgi:SpoVK/Ycf46/Vps4 family AAA+-type ATPase